MTKDTVIERIRLGAHEVQVSITGNRLLPSADVPGCSSSCSSSLSRRSKS
jgi:hypothetical protein